MTSDTLKAITVRMDEHYKELLDAEATADGLSLSEYALTLIEEARTVRSKPQKKARKVSLNPSAELLSEIDDKYKSPADYPSRLDLICKASIEALLLARSQIESSDQPDAKKHEVFKNARLEAKYITHAMKDKK